MEKTHIPFNKFYKRFNIISLILILIFGSVTLSSINVPPLKSTPKFNPLNINNNKDTTISIDEVMLKVL